MTVMINEITRSYEFLELHDITAVLVAFDPIERIIVEGRANGEVRADLDARLATYVVLGVAEMVLTGYVIGTLPARRRSRRTRATRSSCCHCSSRGCAPRSSDGVRRRPRRRRPTRRRPAPRWHRASRRCRSPRWHGHASRRWAAGHRGAGARPRVVEAVALAHAQQLHFARRVDQQGPLERPSRSRLEEQRDVGDDQRGRRLPGRRAMRSCMSAADARVGDRLELGSRRRVGEDDGAERGAVHGAAIVDDSAAEAGHHVVDSRASRGEHLAGEQRRRRPPRRRARPASPPPSTCRWRSRRSVR